MPSDALLAITGSKLLWWIAVGLGAVGLWKKLGQVAWQLGREYLRARLTFRRQLHALPAQVDTMAQDIGKIRSELGRNGGLTLGDRAVRTEHLAISALALLEGVVEAIDHPIVRMGPDGFRMIHANPKAEIFLGVSLGDLVGRGWISCIDERDRDDAMAELARCVLSPPRPFSRVMRWRGLHHRETLTVRLSLRPRSDELGNVILWVGSFKDAQSETPPPRHRPRREDGPD